MSSSELTRTSLHELQAIRRKLIRVAVISAAGVGVCTVIVTQLSASAGTLSYSPAPATTPNDDAIQAAANDYYATRPFERLRFLADENSLGAFIESKVPEVKSVDDLSADGLGRSKMALTLRVPVASWRTNAQTVFVDSDGVAFSHDYFADPLVEVDDAGAGSTAVSASSSTVRYIGKLIALLKSNGSGTVTRVVLPTGTIRELDVYLEGRGYRVKVQLDRDVASQAEDVKAALGYIDAHGGAGEYVDVRVAGKAFYK